MRVRKVRGRKGGKIRGRKVQEGSMGREDMENREGKDGSPPGGLASEASRGRVPSNEYLQSKLEIF
jgi:hypothetical protein